MSTCCLIRATVGAVVGPARRGRCAKTGSASYDATAGKTAAIKLHRTAARGQAPQVEFYEHWARAHEDVSTPRGMRSVSGVGWSNVSREAAQQMANEHLATAKERILLADPPREGSYGYGDGRPLREEVVSTLPDVDGSNLAVISRNGYGSLVLNTRKIMFIDLDFDNVPAGPASFFQRLFGAKQSPQDNALAHVERVAGSYPQWSFRVYRTLAGLRLVLLTTLVDAKDDYWMDVLDAFGSDPMYVKLCRTQASFRARLTPKAWRCEYRRPGVRFPFAARERTYFERWLEGYEKVCASYATCHLLTTIGPEVMPSSVAKVLKLHDAASVAEGKPLG